MVGARLGNAGRDRADADLGDELYRYLSIRIGVFEVIDQLGPVFYRIDVVMPRRRDQSDAGRRMPHSRDTVVDLLACELSAFPGFSPLRPLGLLHDGLAYIFAGDA